MPLPLSTSTAGGERPRKAAEDKDFRASKPSSLWGTGIPPGGSGSGVWFSVIFCRALHPSQSAQPPRHFRNEEAEVGKGYGTGLGQVRRLRGTV